MRKRPAAVVSILRRVVGRNRTSISGREQLVAATTEMICRDSNYTRHVLSPDLFTHVLTVARGYLCVTVAVLTVSCSDWREPSFTKVGMQCPSPDSRLIAVFWVQGGGGAAGWMEQLVTVVPSNVRAADVPSRSMSEDYPYVLKLAHAENVRLRWRDDRSLRVEYPDSALVHYAAPGEVYTPSTPDLRVTYEGVPGDRMGRLDGGDRCESGPVAVPPKE
jgi:hypothetical protein